MHHVKIKVTGKVQGVYFRDTARQVAENLEIQGFARNEPDGSVYIEAEGSDSALNEFMEWCREGPREAEVQGFEHNHHEPIGHRGFAIY
jgi:acylphosphatase